MDIAEIVLKINDFISIRENMMVIKKINTGNITFSNVRDCLIRLGKILEENFEKTYYLANIPAGIANKNVAVVLVKWDKQNISLCAGAKEGFINQKTANKAVERIIEVLKEHY